MLICEKEKCTGCLACMNICPVHAISVFTDEYGKTTPHINDDKCVCCESCVKACPVNNRLEMAMPKKAIAAWSRNDKDVLESSSGGVGAVFAHKIVSAGGVVYGSASIDRRVKHIRIDREQDLDLLRGSKYVQSHIGTAYQHVKKDLLAGKRVLFVGVPCQIAGLYGYLGKKYENLVTVDLICHGTPPFQYLEEHVNRIVDQAWDSISFRGKRDWFLSVYRGEKLVESKGKEVDIYFKAFLDALTYRDNCYSCPYAQPRRCSDITIGDFWGIDRSTLKEPYKGRISLVLLNTHKAIDFWSACSDRFHWEERAREEAMNPTQGNLLHPSLPHPDREKFLELYLKYGFERAVGRTSVGKAVRRNYWNQTLLVRAMKKMKRIMFHNG